MEFRKTLNDDIIVSWPEGFSEMTEEEINEAYRGDDSQRFGLWDKERHIILMILWKKYSPLAIRMTGLKKMLKVNEKMTRTAGAGNDYHFEFFYRKTVGGVECGGYCYTYTTGGIRHAGHAVLIPRKNCVYNIAFTGRLENSAEDQKLLDRILDSVIFEEKGRSF